MGNPGEAIGGLWTWFAPAAAGDGIAQEKHGEFPQVHRINSANFR
jgi:hypothetical protein